MTFVNSQLYTSVLHSLRVVSASRKFLSSRTGFGFQATVVTDCQATMLPP